jgi:type I restriction enzyme S subunit
MAGNVRPFGELFAEPTRNGLTRPKAVRGVGVKMVNMGELFAHARLDDTPMDRVPLSEAECKKFLLHPGDLLFARQSLVLEGAGKCSLFLRDEEPVTFESHVTRVRLDICKADPRFYFYYLQSPHGRAAIRSIVEQGAGASGIRGSDLERLEILWREVDEQRAIGRILGALDDKIELNRRMNETLGATARALFKSWFVDFDPVRAKAEGRDPGLPKPIADMFPDSLDDSDEGSIPGAWHHSRLGAAFIITMGQSPPGETYNEVGEGLPFYQGRADFGFRFPERRVFCTAPTRLASRHDTLVTVRAPVGDINLAAEDCAIGRGVASVRHKSGSRTFTFHAMWSLRDAFAGFEAEGTVFGSIGKADFEGLACVEPPGKIIAAFDRACGPLDDGVERNAAETRTLTALRDTLLPKLVSGELRIPDVDRIVGKAV